jgi:hypothetical protein
MAEQQNIRGLCSANWHGNGRAEYRRGIYAPIMCICRHTPEIFGGPGDRLYKREKRDSGSPEICGERKKLHGTELPGGRVLCVSVGRDEAVIRRYIQDQEAEDKRLYQLYLFKD